MGGCSKVVEVTPPTAPTKLARLTVHIVDLRNTKGQLLFSVYKSADGFPSSPDRAVNWQVLSASTPNPAFIVDLPPGEYAASVLHDENSDGKMNTNIIGIPTEGYGVTNNPKPRRRSVRFSEGAFNLTDAGAELSVSIQYDYF
jgi:uncharacterized protein (DUF2141 family)